MSRTTPPRPLDIEALFPELAAYRGTTTRLHPRPGAPDVTVSSVGGPLLWPADEPWPVCDEAHGRGRGRRPADIHRYREVLAEALARDPHSGPTEDERRLLDELGRDHVVDRIVDTDPLPMVALAQLYRHEVPDLPAGPEGCDLLQVLCCPFDRHGPTGHGMALELRWRRSADVREILTTPPQPEVVGYEGYVAEPCVLHPEQVTTYPFAGVLPEELCARLDAWEEEAEAAAEDEPEETDDTPAYQYDLSIPPGWRAGGYASWHATDPYSMDCTACATPMVLLITIDSSEWDGGSRSWIPVEDRTREGGDLESATPTKVTVGRWGELNVFVCPAEPTHPHRWSIQ
ncbi:DEAD/DEAH box helicase family protein [Streptomyces kanasensis]|uniref:hypothetical protein n=1 Tax=Streptomyces kanasensis TaxID=936756 RepID=UPI0038222635